MKYYVVDVFSNAPFLGNPVAVVICDKQLASNQMQQIAAWFNLSETTFVTDFQPDPVSYQVRIFTPRGELPFAGHPSLGTAAAVKTHFDYAPQTICQHCKAGVIEVRFDLSGTVHLLALEPKMELLSNTTRSQLADVLSLDSAAIEQAAIIDSGPLWITALLSEAESIQDLDPNFTDIEHFSNELQATGIMLGAAMPEENWYKVRTFATGSGCS